jgi:hypothetical protein
MHGLAARNQGTDATPVSLTGYAPAKNEVGSAEKITFSDSTMNCY